MAGFSLVESLVAIALAMVISTAALAMMVTATVSSQTAPEAADVQQRARVAADAILREAMMAGAGVSGDDLAGSLITRFAPIVPRRMGGTGADPFTTVRADALSIAYIPSTPVQTVLTDPMADAGGALRVAQLPNCPLGKPTCGVTAGMTLLLFDDTGRFDLVTVTGVGAGFATIRHRQQADLDFAYPAQSRVAEARSATFYFDPASRQLRLRDGDQMDSPVVDDVVGLTFEYFGDPEPPWAPRPPVGIANCLYDAAGTPVPGLQQLPGGGASLVPLPLAIFADGPWCGAGSFRYDADLLRIRIVRVTLRVQAASVMLRGQSPEFALAGRSRSAARSLPDFSVRFDIAPRNLNPGAAR